MILVERYVNFLIENNLTQRQFLLLYLLYEERMDLLNRYKEQFPSNDNKMLPDYLIQDLIRRDFIVQTKTGGYKLGDSFLKIFVDADEATEQIYNLYPPFINNRGVDIPLTSMDRRIFAKIYINKIKGNYEEHKAILLDIQYGIDNGLITTGIEKFLTSEQWKVLRKLREPEELLKPTNPQEALGDLGDLNNFESVDNDF